MASTILKVLEIYLHTFVIEKKNNKKLNFFFIFRKKLETEVTLFLIYGIKFVKQK